jgi:hypothetical protein
MKYPVIVLPFMRVSGMALFPFILVNHKVLVNDAVTINHEKIHLRQQAELLILPFYFLYLAMYVINLVKYKSHYKAYMAIAFEREAYKHEADLPYLHKRRWYAWLQHF